MYNTLPCVLLLYDISLPFLTQVTPKAFTGLVCLYQQQKLFSLGPLNLICQVRLLGGWSVLGMANFVIEKDLQ